MNWTNLGIDIGLLGAVIAATQVVKLFLPEKLQKWVVLVPVALGVAVSFVVSPFPFQWQVLAGNALKFGAIASWIYKTGKAFLPI